MRKHQRRRPLTLSLRALSELVQEMMVQRAHHSGIQGRTIGPFVPVPSGLPNNRGGWGRRGGANTTLRTAQGLRVLLLKELLGANGCRPVEIRLSHYYIALLHRITTVLPMSQFTRGPL